MRRFLEVWNGLVYIGSADWISHTFGMVIEKCSLRFQERTCREYVFEFAENLVGVFRRLVQFLTTEKMENEGHNVLW